MGILIVAIAGAAACWLFFLGGMELFK